LDQLRYCTKIVQDLYKKQYSSFAQYFYDPVSEYRACPSGFSPPFFFRWC
jgi:hypothetical protein